MPQYKIAIIRISSSGWIANGIGDFLCEVTALAAKDHRIADVIHIKRGKLGHHVSRNSAIQAAIANQCDFAFMLDHDCEPPHNVGVFSDWLNYLIDVNGPCVILAPYQATDGTVPLLLWDSSQASPPYTDLRLRRMTRVEAASLRGFVPVAGGGLTCAAFDMRVFTEVLPKPYFDFLYNEDKTDVCGGEDDYLCRQCERYGVPVVAAMDHFVGHRKEMVLAQPLLIRSEDVNESQIVQAEAVLAARDAMAATATAGSEK